MGREYERQSYMFDPSCSVWHEVLARKPLLDADLVEPSGGYDRLHAPYHETIRAWARDHGQGLYTLLGWEQSFNPDMLDADMCFIVAFERHDDAVHFKIRWG